MLLERRMLEFIIITITITIITVMVLDVDFLGGSISLWLPPWGWGLLGRRSIMYVAESGEYG